MDIVLPSAHVMAAEAMAQSLLINFFFYYIIVRKANIGIHWNLLEFPEMWEFQWIPTDSNRFQWKPFPEAPGFQMIPVDSIRFHWKFHGMENQNGWGSSQMDSVRIPWNSNIPVRIRWIPPELMGESKDLDPMVIDSSNVAYVHTLYLIPKCLDWFLIFRMCPWLSQCHRLLCPSS